MMASGGSSSEGSGHSYESRHAEDADSAKLPEQDVLEDVLRETLAARAGDPDHSAQLTALTEVARKHPGADLDLEPVAVELVEALLRIRFGQVTRTPEVWREASRHIAGVLYETPESQARLRQLWQEVSELAK